VMMREPFSNSQTCRGEHQINLAIRSDSDAVSTIVYLGEISIRRYTVNLKWHTPRIANQHSLHCASSGDGLICECDSMG